MIRSVTGVVVTKTEQAVVIDVNGIGYFIALPDTTSCTVGEKLTVHTHLAVKENALDLYGFHLEDELELFEHLLTLPKIGPKSALQILSQANLPLIHAAVAENDPVQLAKLSGLGKKTAEKVVAGLSDIYEREGRVLVTSPTMTVGTSTHHTDAIDALITLGYPESDARKVVQQLSETKPELTNTNDLIKVALQQLS